MNEIQIIQNFIAQYSDFGSYSNEQYKAVYRPSWHPEPISFGLIPLLIVKGLVNLL
jgi:tryptophan-rich sensory protein